MISKIWIILFEMVLLRLWRLYHYMDRLRTFQSWEGEISPYELACANFEHHALTTVICAECNLSYDTIKFKKIEPMYVHKKYSKNCLFVKCFGDNYKQTQPKKEDIILYWLEHPIVQDFIDLKMYTRRQIEFGLTHKLDQDFTEFESLQDMVEFFNKLFVPNPHPDDDKIARNYICKFCFAKTPRQATHILVPCGQFILLSLCNTFQRESNLS